ncbi:MAG: glycosyltransferase family 2 protein [Nitrospiraceae bacterium]
MHSPVVSVVIIFLNEERFLQDAIESVLSQSYTDWELLLINDGSSDNSSVIATDCAHRFPEQVRYYEHAGGENRGMSASRNYGVNLARGYYVGFLDADDVWMPEALERQVHILNSEPEAGMVCGPQQWWYSWTGDPADCQRDFVHHLGVDSDACIPPPGLLPVFLTHEAQLPSRCLIRRHVIADVGGFEESFRSMYEDQAFLVKLCLKWPVYVSRHCWYRWRKHPDSCCAKAVTAGQHSSSRLKFLEWVESYLSHKRVTHRSVWKALRRALEPYRHPSRYHLRQRLYSLAARCEHRLVAVAANSLPAPVRQWLKPKLASIASFWFRQREI